MWFCLSELFAPGSTNPPNPKQTLTDMAIAADVVKSLQHLVTTNKLDGKTFSDIIIAGYSLGASGRVLLSLFLFSSLSPSQADFRQVMLR